MKQKHYTIYKKYFKFIYWIIVFFLSVFHSYIVAQTSIKSGNIRDCTVWTCGSTTFQNATINNGHTITANSNAVNTNSITLSGNTSIIVFNGGDVLNLTGTTNMSPCIYTYVNNAPLITTGWNHSGLYIGAAGITATSNPVIGSTQAGILTIDFQHITSFPTITEYCSAGGTLQGTTTRVVSVYRNGVEIFTASSGDQDGNNNTLLAPGRSGTFSNGYWNCTYDFNTGLHTYFRRWTQDINAGDIFTVNVKNIKYGADGCRYADKGTVTGYSNPSGIQAINFKIWTCKGTF